MVLHSFLSLEGPSGSLSTLVKDAKLDTERQPSRCIALYVSVSLHSLVLTDHECLFHPNGTHVTKAGP